MLLVWNKFCVTINVNVVMFMLHLPTYGVT